MVSSSGYTLKGQSKLVHPQMETNENKKKLKEEFRQERVIHETNI